ncbi:MAG: S-layer protein [Candidatus Nanohaloarchaea archaeon]
MKSIKKLKNAGKAVAGSALLVGATLTGAAGFAAAQSGNSSSMTLGDYPQPFVDDNGEVDSTIVVGSQGKVSDVVGAINVAGSLGNSAFMEESVSVSVSGTGGRWSASNGVTLDTTNDDLFYGDSISTVRDTLTETDLPTLKEHTFTDDGGTEYDITQYVNVDNQGVQFGNSPDELNNEDPKVHIPVPTESDVDNNNYLINLQANIETLNFSDSQVQGEEIKLFGKTFTPTESDNSVGDNELVMYGSSQTLSLSTGNSTTVTVGGEEVTLGVESVDAGSDNAAIRVNGEVSSESTEDTINVNGEEIRVDELINTGATDNGEGIVNFEIGSEKLSFQDNSAIQDDNGDDIEGTYVTINGGTSYSVGDGVSSMTIYLGSQDDNDDALTSGETFSHSMFGDFEVDFGGLNPDAVNGSESVSEIEYGTSGGDTSTVDLTSSGEPASIGFAYDSDSEDGNTDSSDSSSTGQGKGQGNFDAELADSDGDNIVVDESAAVDEEQFISSDAGDFAHMWEVSNIDRDETSNMASDDEATIDLTDTVTGNSVEVELEAVDGGGDNDFKDGDTDHYAGTEIIDGQTYYFELEGESDTAIESGTQDGESSSQVADFRMAWGSGLSESDATDSGNTDLPSGSVKSLYTPVDTKSGSAVAVTEQVQVASDAFNDASNSSTQGEIYDQEIELPSTESTDAKNARVFVRETGDGEANTDSTLTLTVAGTNETVTADGSSVAQEFTVGQTVYTVDLDSVGSSGDNDGESFNIDVGVSSDQTDDGTGATRSAVRTNPAAITVLPEDDNDEEHSYVSEYSDRSGTDGLAVDAATYSGSNRDTQSLESDDQTTAGVDFYGTYTKHDSDEEGSYMLSIPNGQSTAGVAVTQSEGDLSASGGGGSGSAMTKKPTGWPDAAALDSEVSGSDRNQNLILVGGPAVNTLVAELANQNMTWSGDQYSQNQYLLDLTEGFDGDGGSKALVVAGYGKADTRAAASYLSNYQDHSSEMAGKSTLTKTTAAQ